MPLSQQILQEILIQLRVDGQGVAERTAQELARIKAAVADVTQAFGAGLIGPEKFLESVRELTVDLPQLTKVMQEATAAAQEQDAGYQALQKTLQEYGERDKQNAAEAAALKKQTTRDALDNYQQIVDAEKAAAAERLAAAAEVQAKLQEYGERDKQRAIANAETTIQAQQQGYAAVRQRIEGVQEEVQAETAALTAKERIAKQLQQANFAYGDRNILLKQGLEMEREEVTLTHTEVAALQRKNQVLQQGTDRYQSFSFSVLATGHAIQDLTSANGDLARGFQATINNIPLLVTGWAGMAGVAPATAMAVAGVTTAVAALGFSAVQAGGGLEKIATNLGLIDNPAQTGTARLKEVTKEAESLGAQTTRTAEEQARLNGLVAEQVVLEKNATAEKEAQARAAKIFSGISGEEAEYEKYAKEQLVGVEGEKELLRAVAAQLPNLALQGAREAAAAQRAEYEKTGFYEAKTGEFIPRYSAQQIDTMMIPFQNAITAAAYKSTEEAAKLLGAATYGTPGIPGGGAAARARLAGLPFGGKEAQFAAAGPAAYAANVIDMGEYLESIGLGPDAIKKATQTQAAHFVKKYGEAMDDQIKTIAQTGVKAGQTDPQIQAALATQRAEWIKSMVPGPLQERVGQEIDERTANRFGDALNRAIGTARGVAGAAITKAQAPLATGDFMKSLVAQAHPLAARGVTDEAIKDQLRGHAVDAVKRIGRATVDQVAPAAEKLLTKVIEDLGEAQAATGKAPAEASQAIIDAAREKAEKAAGRADAAAHRAISHAAKTKMLGEITRDFAEQTYNTDFGPMPSFTPQQAAAAGRSAQTHFLAGAAPGASYSEAIGGLMRQNRERVVPEGPDTLRVMQQITANQGQIAGNELQLLLDLRRLDAQAKMTGQQLQLGRQQLPNLLGATPY